MRVSVPNGIVAMSAIVCPKDGDAVDPPKLGRSTVRHGCPYELALVSICLLNGDSPLGNKSVNKNLELCNVHLEPKVKESLDVHAHTLGHSIDPVRTEHFE